jgi:hypothetical protein
MSTPLTSADPSDLANAARCFSSCVPPGLQLPLRTLQLSNVAVIATNPVCTAPTAPFTPQVLNVSNSTIQIGWKQLRNTGSFITGYEVFWGTTSGGPYTNNSGVLPILPRNYTITGLSSGMTYFFVVVALSAVAGCQSANSNQNSATTSGAMCNLSAKVIDWVNRTNINQTAVGTAAGVLSMATQCAVETFYEGLVADGLDASMIAMMLYTPDKLAMEPVGTSQLATMRTPFYVGGGADPWQNQGPFAGADLTVNGLIGDAATKCLATLLDPTVMAWTPANNCGVSLYVIDGSSQAGWGELGVNQPSNSAVNLVAFANLSGTSYGELIGFPTGTASGAAPNQSGFYSVSRTAANATSLYFANSVTAFAALGSTAGASAAPPARGMFVHALANQDNGGSPNFFSGRRFSFVAFHLGLSSAQTQKLYNRVQALRVALGGGFA